MNDLSEFKNIFNPVLDELINKKTDEFLQNTNDPFIRDFVLYSKNLISGGKKIRPYIAYLAYKAFGGTEDAKAIRFFVSFELFHNFCLIHDDIIDKGTLRHGFKTIHNYIFEKLKQEERVGNLEHIGNSQAILMGDLLFSWSMENIDNTKFPKENLLQAKNYFYKMVDEVCLGQIIDVDLTTRINPSYKLIEEKTRLKTSRYSFVRPLQIGASLARVDYNAEDLFENFGTKLGFAFQVQDDLLDLIGNPEETHKNILIDVADGQHTFFTNYINENGTDEQKNYLKSIFGKEINQEDQEKIQNFFQSCGAIDAGKKRIEEDLTNAKTIVNNLEVTPEYKQKFLDLVTLIENRKN